MIDISKVYYINLKEREDRKFFIEKEISKSLFLFEKAERFEAIDGRKIHPRDLSPGFLSERAIGEILSDDVKTWGLSITQGALGVYLSYISIFKEVEKSKSSCVIIEDDTCFSDNFEDVFLKILNELPEDFHICYLGYGEDFIESKEFSENLVCPTGKITCLPALIVSPDGAKKILGLLKNVSFQIDTEIYTKIKQLNAYASKIKIAEVKNSFRSDIQGNKNCQKLYKKQNYIFSTLAHGLDNSTKAMNLARDLDFFDQKIVIITDRVGFFSKIKNVIEIEYKEDYFSYNKKVNCFKEGFKHADAVVYIDADTRVFYENYDSTYNSFLFHIPPGFHPSWVWGGVDNFLKDKDVTNRISGYGDLALSICKDLKIDTNLAKHWQEGILAVSKENLKENIFIDTWDFISSRLDLFEKNNKVEKIGAGEGNIIGLSLIKSGMTIHDASVCNIFGKNLFYNFCSTQIKNFPNRKTVKTTESNILKENTVYVEFKNKKIDLSYKIHETQDNLLLLSFEWNKENNIEFLDHEFKIGETVYHFNSEKYNEFIFEKKINLIQIYHTYDWYGERNWKLIELI